MKTLILISLNELNFDIVKKYLSNNKLKNLKKISENLIETQCEEDYKNLEPWIQWPTIYTGKNANEHNLFRLGDAGIYKKNTIFNDIENLGYRVGAISPMNVSNNLKNPAYFIPDPWTDTISDNSFWSKLTFKTLSYFIKTNAENNFDFKNYVKLLVIFIKFSKFKNYSTYLRLFFTSFKKKWRKALFLDLLLNDIHLDLLKSRKSDFSNLFLNGIAHIQHHYMLSSKISTKQVNPSWYISSSDDPVLEGLEIYEKILQDYTQLKNVKIVIATGLTQIPYDRIKFYYKLNKHTEFFKKFHIEFENIQELMSRDFILHFKSNELCLSAFNIINKITDEKNKKIFGDIEIKGKSLFISLIFDEEILEQTINITKTDKVYLKNYVNFVAIKNGMHSGKGFLYFDDINENLETKINQKLKINQVKEKIFEYFTN